MNLLHNGQKDKDISPLKNYLQFLQRYQSLESFSGLLLLISALFALLVANSPWADLYKTFWGQPLSSSFPHSLLTCVNEGLMTLFFLLVGLELKREWKSGELSKPSQILLPAGAALGGMVVPALIYCLLNYVAPHSLEGWAIPVATDIAFALGVLSLFGKRVPSSLKTFLMALAIFDDVGAILIIAFFYGEGLQLAFLGYAFIVVLGLIALNRLGAKRLWIYGGAGVLLWLLILQSGVHPTIAGVILALTIPEGNKASPLARLEEALHPWVAYLIMPLFAMANAGFALSSLNGAFVDKDRVAEGVIAGLFLGKQLGVFSFAWGLIRLGWARMPLKSSWLELWGVSILCGIGFTMSLFLGTLAFSANELFMIEVRFGVFLGSLLSGIIGSLVLFLAIRWKNK